MQKVAQAMRTIGPIIAKVKLAVIVDEVSDPYGTIAQIDRDFARLAPTGELVLIRTEQRVASLDVRLHIHIGLLRMVARREYVRRSHCRLICKNPNRVMRIFTLMGSSMRHHATTRMLYQESLAFGREFGERQGVAETSVSPERADAVTGPSTPASSLFQKKAENAVQAVIDRCVSMKIGHSSVLLCLLFRVPQLDGVVWIKLPIMAR